VRIGGDGIAPIVESGSYRLTVVAGRPVALLDDARGDRWAELRLLASLDTLDGADETTAVVGPEVDERDGGAVVLTWGLASTVWARKSISLTCREDEIEVRTWVSGAGRLTTVELLGGPATIPPAATGRFASGAWFETLFSPAPSDPARIVQPAAESSTIGVVGGSEPGRGHWFFTPGPFCYAVNRVAIADAAEPPVGEWLTFGLAASVAQLNFTDFEYLASDRGFRFALRYEGHTVVDGEFAAPALLIGFGAADPYDAIRRHRSALVERGLAARLQREPPSAASARPAWWREPMFCGWGAQCHLARAAGQDLGAAASFSRQDRYDGFLATLEANGVIPGTVVIDDKWQADYGTGDPDASKWPDLRGWIADRHARGQRVLLWWKAWDGGNLPPELWVRTARGEPVALDPENPDARAAIQRGVAAMLGADELNADGLKIDFTARTPSGSSLRSHGPAWGVGLLRQLLATVHAEAKRVRPDALIIGHTPNPAVDPYVDVIRLNDMLRLDDPRPVAPIVTQMRYRAGVVRAASPDHLIDTDDWCAPDLASWRAFASIKRELGVPALYYATHLDFSGEALTAADYALLRGSWAAYRRDQRLPDRG
jgi:hypothetical protein